MAAVHLTSRFCDSVKPPTASQATYPDAQVRGLEFRVYANGRRSWSVRYRSLARRQCRVTLGGYPVIDLSRARAWAMKVLAEVAEGRDPAREKREERALAYVRSLRTFDALAEAYFTACERGEWQPKGKPQRARTIADGRACHRRYVRPKIGSTPIDEIKRSTIKGLLREMVASGIEAQTKRTHAFIRAVFAWAMSEFDDDERIPFNPAVGFAPIGRVKPRTRVYSDVELRLLWNGLNTPEAMSLPGKNGPLAVGVSRPMAIIIQLCAVTLQRKSEVAGMHERELDLVHRTWLIPGERTKGGWPQLVPLSPLAVRLIEEAKRLRREQDEELDVQPTNRPRPVFPSRNDPEAAVRGDSLTHAMAKIVPALGLSGVTIHDLRRTGSTLMTSERLKIMPFIRSKVLGHRGDPGGGAAVSMLHYDSNEYVSEKRQALEAWSELLKRIVEPDAESGVAQAA